MHIVDVMPVIPFILDQMLPIAPLPDPAFAAGALSCRQHFGLRQASGESEFDDFPAQGEIGVAAPVASRCNACGRAERPRR